MNQTTIAAIVTEIEPILARRFLGKIFQLTPFSLVLDFGLREGNYLLLSAEPKSPRIYLVNRRVRELEKASQSPGPFAQSLRSLLSNATLTSIATDPIERVVSLSFSQEAETGATHAITLLAQLTGRSANLYLLNSEGVITHALRTPRGEGQQIGDVYKLPPRQTGAVLEEAAFEKSNFPSLSAAADNYFLGQETAERFIARTQSIRDRLRRQLTQREKLRKNLLKDLDSHGDALEHKRLGELLLANIGTAERQGQKVRIKDYYSAGEPMIELEVDENQSLQDEAARYFSRYSKSKRAKEEIAKRLTRIEEELGKIKIKQQELERVVQTKDEKTLERIEGPSAPTPKRKRDHTERIPGVRRYLSSDGYEILVGRAAQTNDRLTFKVAKPHDLWLHAADYPGSHVIVRNSSRKEIPQRTVIEAAQLAAKFSQAGEDSKVNVNCAERKFISKPKGAAPGLVRMSSFRTVSVEPGENIQRLEN